MAPKRVFVVGVGMTKFEKPGKHQKDYPDFAEEAGKKALADAKIDFSEVQQAVVGYVYGDSTCGQRAVYNLGMSGIPVINVNNNCSTGSTALFVGKQLIEGGLADCVLALGFEKMDPGSLSAKFTDRTNPMDRHMNTMAETRGITAAPFAPQMFGNAGREHMEKYGTTKEQFAKIAEKNHRHSVNNPYSQFRDVYTLQDVLSSKEVFEPLTRLQCCPTSDGAAAAILASEDFVHRHHLESQAVEIAAMAMATDTATSFKDSCIKMVGFDMSKAAADEVYRKSGLSPKDAQVVELHDCFSCNELITYEALGLCKPGEGGKLIDRGDVTYGGKWVVNPSGGLISKGHPLGATGLAQCAELSWQLRQMCGPRQVPNCKAAIQHNIGLGGAAVVAVYRLGFPEAFQPFPAGRPNPAIEVTSCSGFEEPLLYVEPSPVAAAAGFQSDALFAELGKRVSSKAVAMVKGLYQFNVKGPGGEQKIWTVDLKNGEGLVKEGAPEKADCTITIADEDFVGLITGKANGQQLFMQGKLKIAGNMALAMKLEVLKKLNDGPAPSATSADAGFQSDAIFQELSKRVSAEVVNKVKGIYQFKITNNGAEKIWSVDLKNGNGLVKEGPHEKPDCTITIADQDYVNLITGKSNGQQLFMQGKLKIAGNMAMAMKLSVLSSMNDAKPSATAGAEGFKSDAIFAELENRIKADPSLIKTINGVYQFKITNGPGGATKTWVVDLKKGAVQSGEGAADCTVTITDEDYVNLLTGKANGQQLFMQGKLKIAGNMAMAMKLSQLSATKASL